MQTHDLKIRLSSAEKLWLSARAEGNRRSMTAEIRGLVETAMREDPVRILITHCNLLGVEFYTASVGVTGADFYEGPSREEAIAAAKSKAKELGLPRAAIVFEAISDKREASTDGERHADQ